MSNFIELHDDENNKFMLNLDTVVHFYGNKLNGTTFIIDVTKWNGLVSSRESYSDVIKLLECSNGA